MMFVLMLACQDLWAFREEKAKINARSFMSDMGQEPAGMSCSGNDSDGDWYVSCTVLLADGQRWPLECGVFENMGCRERALVNVIGQQPTE